LRATVRAATVRESVRKVVALCIGTTHRKSCHNRHLAGETQVADRFAFRAEKTSTIPYPHIAKIIRRIDIPHDTARRARDFNNERVVQLRQRVKPLIASG